jgi:hypothetical protein
VNLAPTARLRERRRIDVQLRDIKAKLPRRRHSEIHSGRARRAQRVTLIRLDEVALTGGDRHVRARLAIVDVRGPLCDDCHSLMRRIVLRHEGRAIAGPLYNPLLGPHVNGINLRPRPLGGVDRYM